MLEYSNQNDDTHDGPPLLKHFHFKKSQEKPTEMEIQLQDFVWVSLETQWGSSHEKVSLFHREFHFDIKSALNLNDLEWNGDVFKKWKQEQDSPWNETVLF